MPTIQRCALIVTIFGALNLGLIGLLNIDMISTISGETGSTVTKVINILIGIAGVINLGLFMMKIEERR